MAAAQQLWPLDAVGTMALALIALACVVWMVLAAISSQHARVEPARRPAAQAGRPLPATSHTAPPSKAVVVRTIKYRTQDGRHDYGFCFAGFQDGTWRVYIVSQPGYDGRPSDAHVTHRLTDDEGNRFICWTVPITTAEGAKNIAATWAEATERYRKTGQQF